MNRHDIKDKVKDLLLTTNLSCTAIGKLFGVSRGPISMLKSELDIHRPNPRIKNKRICKWCKKDFMAHGLASSRPNRGKYCSKECYRKWQLSSENSGSNHPNWVDGGKHEKEVHALRHSPEWAAWRSLIYSRDNYMCRFCSSKKELEPHHIYPRRDYPDRVFDQTNGITLCRPCHIQTINKEYDYIEKCEAVLMHMPAMR